MRYAAPPAPPSPPLPCPACGRPQGTAGQGRAGRRQNSLPYACAPQGGMCVDSHRSTRLCGCGALWCAAVGLWQCVARYLSMAICVWPQGASPWRDPHMYERGTTHRAAAAGCTGPDGQRMMRHMSSCSVSDRVRWRISQHAMGYIQGALCPPQWTGALTTVCLSVDP